MYAANRRLIISAASVLVVAALVGYIVGHGHAASAPSEKSRSLLAGSVLVEAPVEWRLAAPPTIPGLVISKPVVVAPGSDPAEAGLLSGELPAGEPSPLPSSFVSHLSGMPETAIVNLVQAQAFRYSHLHVTGFSKMLTVFAIPNPGGRPAVTACYAATNDSRDMQVCERIVATLTVVNLTHSYDLTPEPGYARQLSRPITSLDRERVTLRREMYQHNVPTVVQGLAERLATAFANAAISISLLEPPLVAHRAQQVLDGAVLNARGAYYGLVGAVASRSPSRYNAARTRVDEAEASVDSALENLILLGYQPSAPPNK